MELKRITNTNCGNCDQRVDSTAKHGYYCKHYKQALVIRLPQPFAPTVHLLLGELAEYTCVWRQRKETP